MAMQIVPSGTGALSRRAWVLIALLIAGIGLILWAISEATAGLG